MRASRWLTGMVVAGIILGCSQASFAETYRMPIRNAEAIFKVWVEGGQAKKIGKEGDITIYEVTMKDDRCVTELAVQPVAGYSETLRMSYNVCWEKGFSLIGRRN